MNQSLNCVQANASQRVWLYILLGLGAICWNAPAIAQVVPDATLGAESSQVNSNVTVSGGIGNRIQGGALRGANLFHSFQEFNVNSGQRIYFANPANVQNIFSRVTGSNRSTINGTLGVDGGANLFLLNPNGILFGPNARLDIRGSFLATTANSFQFPGGTTFSATNPQGPPLLTVNVPVGLQYGSNSTGVIQNGGNLTTGQDLTLAATNLDLQGQLQAGRDLTLQAQDTVQIQDTIAQPFLAQSGRNLTIQGNQTVDILALNHPQSSLQSGGNLNLISNGSISGDAHFSSGGAFSVLDLNGNPGKFISLYDPIIYANGDVIFGDYDGAALKIEATGSIRAGNITITGPDTAVPLTDPDYAILTTQPALILRSGVTSVPSSNIPTTGGGTNFTNTIGIPLGITIGSVNTSTNVSNANGGAIILSAANGNISTRSLSSGSSPSSGDSGNGGVISLTAASGAISVNGNVSSVSFTGNGNVNSRDSGAITFVANDSILVNGSVWAFSYSLGPSGNGGAITLAAANGSISVNGTVNAYTRGVGSSGTGGAITLTAPNGSISVVDAVQAYSSSSLGGNGGAITLFAPNGLISFNRGPLSAPDSPIYIDSSSISSTNNNIGGDSGNGGAISLIASNLSLDPTTFVFTSSNSDRGSSGEAGSITLTATNGSLVIAGDLYADSDGEIASDNGGNISLVAPNGSITNTGVVASYSNSSDDGGNGGNISLTARDITLSSTSILDSSGLADDGGTSGSGGTIQLTATHGSIRNDGFINSFSFLYPASDQSVAISGETGDGGAISLNASQGDIIGNGSLNSFSLAGNGGFSGSGGDVDLIAKNTISGLQVFTLASSGIGGTVRASGTDGLSLSKLTISTSEQAQVVNPDFDPKKPVSSNNPQTISTVVGGLGESGDVVITSLGNLTLSDSLIQSDTKGSGAAGNVTVKSVGAIAFNNSQIISNTSGSGDAGNVTIDSPGLVTFNSSQIISNTSSSGQAGSIAVTAGQGITLADARSKLLAQTQGSGAAGSITLDTNQLRVRSGEVSTAGLEGSGNAGDITISARGITVLDSSNSRISSSVSEKSTGNGGIVQITTESLSVNNGAAIAASTSGRGNAGNVIINATGNVSLQQDGQISSAVRAGAEGTGGQIVLMAGSLNLSSGGKIEGLVAGSTASGLPGGRGNAGSIQLSVQGETQLLGAGTQIVNSVGKGATGTGGNISLKTNRLTLADGAFIDSTLLGAGKQAGDITITAVDQINLGTGAEISVSNKSSEPGGLAGNIKLNTKVLKLDTNSSITAETSSGGGGNIQITASQLILMRRNSQISTTAGSAESGGNGGNIMIQTPFLVALPKENSDIIANAFGGKGGTIKINANRVFGLQTRSRLSPDQIKTIRTNGTSDISASSDVGSDGQVDISTLQVDPSQGLAELVVSVVDPSNLISQECSPDSAEVAKQRSEFVITGRGGLPPSVDDPQTGGGISVPWVRQMEGRGQQAADGRQQGAGRGQQGEIPIGEQQVVEAQGIAIAPDGTPMLTAQASSPTLHQSGFPKVRCRDRKVTQAR